MPLTPNLDPVPRQDQGWRLVVAWGVAAALYVGLAQVSGMTAFAGQNVCPVWLPAGFSLAVLLLGGYRMTPGLLLGALAANLGQMPLAALLVVGFASIAGVLVAFTILRQLQADRGLVSVRSLWAFLLAILACIPISATAGVLVLQATGELSDHLVQEAWWTWATGDAIGLLLLVPLLAAWRSWRPRTLERQQAWEAIGLGILTLGMAWIAFHGAPTASLPAAFLLFPLQVWTTLRFHLRGATLLAVAVAVVAVVGTAQGEGPFGTGATLNQRLLALQSLLAGLAVTGLALAVVQRERERALAELVMAEASFQHAHDLILWIDDQNRLVRANAEAARRLGYTPDELQGRSMHRLAEDLETGSWRHPRDHASVQETALRTADGGRIPVEVSIARITDPRLPVGWTCAIARDLSERKAMDQRLQEMAKMEALGRLAGGIAHDFNNVLAVIIGYAESLQQRQDLAEPATRAVGHIRTAGERAAGMTRQLLAFSRHQVVEPRAIDVAAVAAEALPLLERLIGSQVRIHLVRPEGYLTIIAEPTQVQQVLMNLAANARDAMPDGGSLRIRLEAVAFDTAQARQLGRETPREVSAIRAGRFVLLVVEDDGLGMAPDVRDRLFEPFFTTKPVGKGTGLGLSSVQGIVRQCGGFVTVASAPGQGTCFRLYFPQVEGPPREPSRSDAPAVVPRRRVLVVDDQAAVRDLVTAMLVEAGHEVVAAGDAEAARGWADRWAPDLLVTDLLMPGTGGRALAEELRRGHPHLPVVFISGFPDDQMREALPPGCRFLAKPFRRDALLRVIADLMTAPAP